MYRVSLWKKGTHTIYLYLSQRGERWVEVAYCLVLWIVDGPLVVPSNWDDSAGLCALGHGQYPVPVMVLTVDTGDSAMIGGDLLEELSFNFIVHRNSCLI
jgi:hypothetical protein